MQKAKRVFGCIGVTLFIWIISRFIPSFIRVILGSNTTSILFTYIVALPIGWALSRAISQGNHSLCIRVNLYIFAIIEVGGLCEVLSYLLQPSVSYAGQFSTDIYGILLLLEVTYIAACLFLAKKTPSTKTDNRIAVDSLVVETSDLSPSICEDITAKKGETYYYMESANGMTVRVPESELESWQAEQDRIRSNPASAKLTDKEQLLVDAIVRDIYGSKDDNNGTTESAPPIAPAHNSKQRFCRMCGGTIDFSTKKCTKCGKQYFNLCFLLSNLKKVFLIGLILALIASDIYLIIRFVDARNVADSYKQKISTLNVENQARQDRIDNLLLELSGYEQLANDLLVDRNNEKRALSFYDEYIVFAVVKESINGYDISYHKYDCVILEGLLMKDNLIVVHNINSIDVKKLTCPHCFD